MMDYCSCYDAKKYRELLAKMIEDNVPSIPTSLIVDLARLDLVFHKDVEEMEKTIENNMRSDGTSIVQLIDKVMTPFNEDQELDPKCEIVRRIIPLPPKNHPHYRALLNIEAESIVREWCEIYIKQAGLE